MQPNALPSAAPVNTVFYNGACPACRVVIEGQRSLMGPTGQYELLWVDINSDPTAAPAMGLSLEDVRERMFVVTDDGGQALQGVAAVAQMFENTRGLKWTSKWLRKPAVSAAGQRIFNRLARKAYAWNIRNKRWTPGGAVSSSPDRISSGWALKTLSALALALWFLSLLGPVRGGSAGATMPGLNWMLLSGSAGWLALPLGTWAVLANFTLVWSSLQALRGLPSMAARLATPVLVITAPMFWMLGASAQVADWGYWAWTAAMATATLSLVASDPAQPAGR